jgi:hypothetical protein
MGLRHTGDPSTVPHQGFSRVRERGRTPYKGRVEPGEGCPGSRHPPDKAWQPWSVRSSLDSAALGMLSPSTCRASVLEGDHVGHIYIRGRIWWLSYTQDGRTIRESARTKDKGEARKLLREREHQVDKGERVISRKGTWTEASAALLNYYRAYGSRDVQEAAYRLAHLDQHFGPMRLSDLDSASIAQYVITRKAQGAANGTVNIELLTLGVLSAWRASMVGWTTCLRSSC